MRGLAAAMAVVSVVAARAEDCPRPVRVELKGGGSLEGVLEREEPGTLRVRLPGQGRITIPRERVVRLETLAARPDLAQQRAAPEEPRKPPQVAPGAPIPGAPRPGTPGRERPKRVDPATLVPELERLASSLEPAVCWRCGTVAGDRARLGERPGEVFALDMEAMSPLGALALGNEPGRTQPRLELYDARGQLVACDEGGLAVGASELLFPPADGRHYLFVTCAQLDHPAARHGYRLLLAPAFDLTLHDRSDRLQDGRACQERLRPGDARLADRPAHLFSFELGPGEAASFSCSPGWLGLRMFTPLGLPLPGGQPPIPGLYHLAVLGDPCQARKVDFEVTLRVRR